MHAFSAKLAPPIALKLAPIDVVDCGEHFPGHAFLGPVNLRFVERMIRLCRPLSLTSRFEQPFIDKHLAVQPNQGLLNASSKM